MSIISNIKTGLGHFFKLIFRRKAVVFTILVVLGVIFYFGYQASKSGIASASYVTETVSKGTIITSVSGSGQITVGSQVNINPTVSGKVISLDVKNGQVVKAGTVIAKIDDVEGQKAVRDAKINLQNAQISLQKLNQPADQYSVSQAKNDLDQANLDLSKLKEPPTAYDLLSAQNAVSQAQRDLDQAKSNSDNVTLNSTQTLQKGYDDGYTAVSDTFVDLSSIMKDAYKVEWDDADPRPDHLSIYRAIFGNDTTIVDTFANNYDDTSKLYNTDLSNFKISTRAEDQAASYKLLADTETLAEDVANMLESARNLFDAIKDRDYGNYVIKSAVDNLYPKIQSDITLMNGHLDALRNAKNTIDTAQQSGPSDLKDAQAAITSSQENLAQKQAFLANLQAGASSDDLATAQANIKQKQEALNKILAGSDKLDIKSQELAVEQRKNALSDAQNALNDYQVKAPFDGIVSSVGTTKGDTIGSGTTVATLISSKKLADVSLNEVDMVKLKLGQKATLTFDAIDGLSISGEVEDIDTVGTVSQGVVTYNVKVAFDTEDDRVRPGMSVDAAIITEVKQDVLLVSNSDIKTQGNVKYVEVIDNPNKSSSRASTTASNISTSSSSTGLTAAVSNVTPREQVVETGLTNDTQTEITSGLNEGDVVVVKTSSNTTAASKTTTSSRGGFGGIPGLGGGPGG